MTPRREDDEHTDLIPGTLEMLILHVLAQRRLHGYGIVQHLSRVTGEVLKVEGGSLHPALRRLEAEACVTSTWDASATGRRARVYAITAAGRRRLKREVSRYQRAISAIARVLQPDGETP